MSLRDIIDLPDRWYSKTHRREYLETSWLEKLGEQILDGIAKHNPKAFEVAYAVLNHMEKNQKFYEGVNK